VQNIVMVSGGSGRFSVESPKGVTASVADGKLSASVPGPGSYDLVVTDLCVSEEKQIIEVYKIIILNILNTYTHDYLVQSKHL
jgi:hypothetical protein